MSGQIRLNTLFDLRLNSWPQGPSFGRGDLEPINEHIYIYMKTVAQALTEELTQGRVRLLGLASQPAATRGVND